MSLLSKIFVIDGSGSKDGNVASKKTPIYEFRFEDNSIHRVLVGTMKSPYSFFLDQATIATNEKPILIAADVVVGVPVDPSDVYTELPKHNFLGLLDSLNSRCNEQTWRDTLIARGAENRTPLKPFVDVQKGEKIGDWAGKRKCDRITNGSSVYPVGNSAKQVGKAALQFWVEVLVPLRIEFGKDLSVWPFEDVENASVIVGECYPRLCQQTMYGRVVNKRNALSVVDALVGYREANPDKFSVSDSVWMHAASSEDEFDMFSTAAALGRWFSCDKTPFKYPPETQINQLEGWMLGLASDAKPSTSRTERSRMLANTAIEYPCPIDGCPKVFYQTRSGWDAHVTSIQNHATWCPELTSASERKERFRREYPEFFN